MNDTAVIANVIATIIMTMTRVMTRVIPKESRLVAVAAAIAITETTMIPETITIAVAQAPPHHMTRPTMTITMIADIVRAREGHIIR